MRVVHLLCTAILVAGFALIMANQLLAAKYCNLVWEAEDVQKLSGKAFRVEKYPVDPTGEVSGKQVLGLPKVAPGQTVAKDEVTYKVKIPETGTYFLWGRTYWATGCANSVTVNMLGNDWVLGKDGTYDCLHWVCLSDGGDNKSRPRPLRLKQGVLVITLKTRQHQGGIKIDEFMLTNDKGKEVQGSYKPTMPSVLVKDAPAKKK